VGVIRYDEDLEAAKAELKRILDEDFPKMAVRSSEREYNLDWKEAIENLNILQSAQLMVEATLLREESRMQYIRPSFPDIDDDNWKKMLLLLSLDDSGEFVSEKHQMASID
jgi:succinate dehydrogenase/fumarate reductase flavoprotein subunit